ncbi:hypothetical protein EXIGLDRAFT_718413 [Exidia glandulosa HHB12029]|uniref:Extracellular membrane protein CFEM domain-containing protein n=1 Tax=Exidia glandulosa HHB12029 TaxID=1314781 RepID=A0A166MIB7_EXIGL|nr:hypothetical protein EXIGLDRAFT_718413 [Exidia glandulosa HHB12029]
MRVSALFVLIIAASVVSAQTTSNGTTGGETCFVQCSQHAAQNSTSVAKERLTECIKNATSDDGIAKCICGSDVTVSSFDLCLQQSCPGVRVKFDSVCTAAIGSANTWGIASSLFIGSAGLLLAGLVLL